jgi:hypothetical protein
VFQRGNSRVTEFLLLSHQNRESIIRLILAYRKVAFVRITLGWTQSVGMFSRQNDCGILRTRIPKRARLQHDMAAQRPRSRKGSVVGAGTKLFGWRASHLVSFSQLIFWELISHRSRLLSGWRGAGSSVMADWGMNGRCVILGRGSLIVHRKLTRARTNTLGIASTTSNGPRESPVVWRPPSMPCSRAIRRSLQCRENFNPHRSSRRGTSGRHLNLP